jgi:hypothetical protein
LEEGKKIEPSVNHGIWWSGKWHFQGHSIVFIIRGEKCKWDERVLFPRAQYCFLSQEGKWNLDKRWAFQGTCMFIVEGKIENGKKMALFRALVDR